MTTATEILEPFVPARAICLTTFRRDGTPVATPVSIAVDGERAFVRTYESSGKFKRLRNNPLVEVCPSTLRGTPRGPAIRALARVLDSDEAERARRLIEAKHPVLHGLLVPLAHRLTGKRTVYLELVPLPSSPTNARSGAEGTRRAA